MATYVDNIAICKSMGVKVTVSMEGGLEFDSGCVGKACALMINDGTM